MTRFLVASWMTAPSSVMPGTVELVQDGAVMFFTVAEARRVAEGLTRAADMVERDAQERKPDVPAPAL